MRFKYAVVLIALALSGCSTLAALVPPANNDADTTASYVVQVCKLTEAQRANAVAAMNATIAPRSIALVCP